MIMNTVENRKRSLKANRINKRLDISGCHSEVKGESLFVSWLRNGRKIVIIQHLWLLELVKRIEQTSFVPKLL